MHREEFGQRIAKCRKKMGLSQAAAAAMMKVQRTSLSRGENGHEMPSGPAMGKLRDHLRVPIGENDFSPSTAETQMLLPFDFEQFAIDLRISPQRATVQFDVQIKKVAS
jgi:transcriptional regulator with XRE-family HTH domain